MKPETSPKPSVAADGRLGRAKAWVAAGRDPLAGLYLTIPVFLLYHVGILFIEARNGVDLVSTAAFGLLKASTAAYVGVTLGVAVGVIIAIQILRRRGAMQRTEWAPMLIESLVLAFVVPVVAGSVSQLFSWASGIGSMGVFDKFVMAAGAGFHEELVFRVGLFGGVLFLLRRFGKLSPTRAALISAVVTSLAFSAVHYIGPFGDDFQLASFVFRAMAGGLLAAIYHWRGFAVAVYTHMFYDVFVFFFVG